MTFTDKLKRAIFKTPYPLSSDAMVEMGDILMLRDGRSVNVSIYEMKGEKYISASRMKDMYNQVVDVYAGNKYSLEDVQRANPYKVVEP